MPRCAGGALRGLGASRTRRSDYSGKELARATEPTRLQGVNPELHAQIKSEVLRVAWHTDCAGSGAPVFE